MELTPLELSALADCVKRGSTRTTETGLVDTLLSGLCSKPSLEAPYVKWRSNPGYRSDGYTSLYEPTELGRQLIEQSLASGMEARERLDGEAATARPDAQPLEPKD